LEARPTPERSEIDDTPSRVRDGTGESTISPDDDLRSALSRLLASGAESLAVVGADGRPHGRLTLEHIRAVAAQQQPAAQAA
jgi:hypothetical protein